MILLFVSRSPMCFQQQLFVMLVLLLFPEHNCVSNGHMSYRTRAKTGSLRPKRYMSTDEEEERDLRKNNKRAKSYSSRESSLHLADEEDNESTESSSDGIETHSESDNRTSKRRKPKSKAVKCKRRKVATRSKYKNSKKRHRRDFSSGDEDNESDSEESDSSDSESEEEAFVQKPKPKSRSAVIVDKQAPGRKHSSSGKRTTRNQGKRTFNYLEDSYDEYEDDPSRLSVSSRGRLRKMTKRARANRTDDWSLVLLNSQEELNYVWCVYVCEVTNEVCSSMHPESVFVCMC